LIEQKVVLRHWTVKRSFDSFERRENIKELDH